MFRPPFMAIFKEVLYLGCITQTSKPTQKYKILTFIYMVLNDVKIYDRGEIVCDRFM
jgi:hypothetical protein